MNSLCITICISYSNFSTCGNIETQCAQVITPFPQKARIRMKNMWAC